MSGLGFRGRGSRGGASRGGGGRGGFRGGSRGGFRGGRGGGGGSGFQGPPQSIVEVGKVMHPCESQLVCQSTLDKQVPYFNGRIFLENKEEVGKVDEILGPINEFYFSVKLGEGMKAESFASSTTFYIDSQQLLPISRFLAKPQAAAGQKGIGGGRGGRGGRGGMVSRGRGRGGSSFSRGGGRGGFSRGSSRGGRGGFGGRGR